MQTKSIFTTILTLYVCAMFACANVSRDNTADPNGGSYLPTSAQVTPPGGTDINGRDQIVIVFNDPVDTGSVEITGDMARCRQVWGSTTIDNDTLTLTPGISGNSIWPIGEGETIIIKGKNMYGIDIDDISLAYNVNYSVTYTALVVTNSAITGHEKIIVNFSDDMDTATLSVSNAIGTSNKAWSGRKLTLTPSGGLWNSGTNSVTITCETWDGVAGKKPTASVVLDYEVFYGTCVSATSGDDTNDGTVLGPVLTVSNGIAKAKSTYTDNGIPSSQVRIAKGTYSTNYNNNVNRIIMIEGISLYGGYSGNNWSVQNTALNETKLQDLSGDSGTNVDPNRTIDCPINITNNTIIDKLTINAGDGDASAAIFCHDGSSPTIQNNLINGGGNIGSSLRYAINNYSDQAATGEITKPVIKNNIINGGGGAGVAECYGIYNNNSSPTINNNNIDGGSGIYSYGIVNDSTYADPKIISNKISGGISNYSCGIANWNSSPQKIQNNLIFADKGTSENYGIYNKTGWFNPGIVPVFQNNIIICGKLLLDNPASPPSLYCIYNLFDSNGSFIHARIENNIMILLDTNATATYVSFGIYETTSSTANVLDPTTIKNNVFWNFDIFNTNYAFYFNEGTTKITTISGMEALNPANYSSNITDDPGFQNISANDFHYSTSSPTEIVEGGLDLSSSFDEIVDRDGNSRTVPWSIGAYEHD